MIEFDKFRQLYSKHLYTEESVAQTPRKTQMEQETTNANAKALLSLLSLYALSLSLSKAL